MFLFLLTEEYIMISKGKAKWRKIRIKDNLKCLVDLNSNNLFCLKRWNVERSKIALLWSVKAIRCTLQVFFFFLKKDGPQSSSSSISLVILCREHL